ncbi:MAG: FumA C-terminus/TtdB family hydratase beta subunit [Nitrospirota bacterium]|nr:FumA C-terminus/TtdB family hydratase beta subunit [Nitrospirota bacterium]
MVEPKKIKLPLSSEDVAGLKVGDLVLLSGNMVSGRDRMHKYLVEERPSPDDIPFNLSGAVIYHCGPVIKKVDDSYMVIAAGPTTSMRVEMYEARVIREYGIKGIIGKGGMGGNTLRALQENGCVYFNTTGGAAVYLADRIKKILDVWKLDEFGPTEAMWLFEVDEFPAIVTMDAHGNNMHRDIEELSFRKFSELMR